MPKAVDIGKARFAESKLETVEIQPRFRVMRGRDIALGPGKADLLEQVRRTGSIAEAAAQMGMSYMRAWKLLKTMDRCFAEPLIKVSRGGAQHGGAKLTAHGVKALELYREMEAESSQVTAAIRRRMIKLLRDRKNPTTQFMPTSDQCCTIAPYFKVKPGEMGAFKKLCEQFITKTKTEPGCLYYGFAFDGDMVYCREGYTDADALLVHLKNVGAIVDEALKISELVRLEVHGPESELAKLRSPLAALKPTFYTLEYGFRK